jgi:hypothetical protein
VRASDEGCAWSAQTDVTWVRLRTASGTGESVLRFDVEANRMETTREGRIEVNGERVRVVQFGSGEVQPSYMTLRPEETVVSSKGGSGVLTFYYGLGDLAPAVTESDWLQVFRVVRNGDRREVTYYWGSNPELEERVGSLLVGGKRYTVLQRGADQ